MNLSGRWKIRATVNENTGKISYRTVLSTKKLDGTYEYYTMFVNFVGEAKYKVVDDNIFINVEPDDAWLSFYRKSEDESQMVAMVKDFKFDEELGKVEAQPVETYSDDDLPF